MSSARPPTPLDTAKAAAERVVGAKAAGRIGAFHDGRLHVRAGEGARVLAWAVDFVTFVVLVLVGIVGVSLVDRRAGLADDQVTFLVLGVLVVVPLLYGALCFRGGRALGGVLTGTRLVRVADGGRVGAAAPWVMLLRTILLPLFLALLATAGGAPVGSLSRRVAVDTARTEALGAHQLPYSPGGYR